MKDLFINYSLFFIFTFFQFGCFGLSEVSLPEAPPPDAYKNSKMEPLSVDQSVLRPISRNNLPERTDFSRKSIKPLDRHNKINKKAETNSGVFGFRLKAAHDVRVWIQDKDGKEIAWKRLLKGNEFKIIEKGPLTLTCSSSNSLIVYDSKGTIIHDIDSSTGSKRSIDIIRVP